VRTRIIIGIALVLVFIPAVASTAGFDTVRQFLSSIFAVTITPADLRARYTFQNIKVLVVPGHDSDYPGTEHRGLLEADLNLKVAEHLLAYLKNDSHFVALATRNPKTGAYTDEFSSYFKREEGAIKEFYENAQILTTSLFNANLLETRQPLQHAFAPGEMVTRLYGINKWANENKIDITLHIHLNDYPGRNHRRPGKYSGFTIYVPERQYPNGPTSRDFAAPVFQELSTSLAVSDLPQEMAGVVEDQELIAIGSNASREGVSLLIEYGYIYEPQFINPETQNLMAKELALLTYRGMKRYFEAESVAAIQDTMLLPHTWHTFLAQGIRGNMDVLALQKALTKEKLYPPPGKTLSECPINGNFGPCVESSVKLFQEKYATEIYGDVKPALYSGTVGEATRKVLNAWHSAVR